MAEKASSSRKDLSTHSSSPSSKSSKYEFNLHTKNTTYNSFINRLTKETITLETATTSSASPTQKKKRKSTDSPAQKGQYFENIYFKIASLKICFLNS